MPIMLVFLPEFSLTVKKSDYPYKDQRPEICFYVSAFDIRALLDAAGICVDVKSGSVQNFDCPYPESFQLFADAGVGIRIGMDEPNSPRDGWSYSSNGPVPSEDRLFGDLGASTVGRTARRFLTYAALVERGIFNNRMTLKRAMDKQRFPRPYKLGERRVGWDAAEVEAWLASRKQ